MPLAKQDLSDIEEYIGKDNPKAAVEFVQRLATRFSDLILFPKVGRKRGNYRTVTEGDYIIFYRLPNWETVEVMRVIHGKRDLRKI